ncbi:MAG: ribose-phosphate diphosphokinase [Candidatus Binatia bacterium]
MNVSIFSGSANPLLTTTTAQGLGISVGQVVLQRFPDGELHVEIQESVRGHDVYLIQPTSPPVETHLLELLFLADACRRAGAASLTAIIPYFGYARQDRRASGREPVGARLVAELLQASGIQRVVTVDPHTSALEGFFRIPVEHLSAVPVLAAAVQASLPPEAVVVAPDLGAAKLAERYARVWQLPIAIVHKTRLSGKDVQVQRIIGEVRDRVPIVVDDMISTGGTIQAALQAVLAAGGRSEQPLVVASHGLLVGPAHERLRGLPLGRVLVTDSVAQPASPPWLQVVSLGPLLAEVVTRLHNQQSLSDLLTHT